MQHRAHCGGSRRSRARRCQRLLQQGRPGALSQSSFHISAGFAPQTFHNADRPQRQGHSTSGRENLKVCTTPLPGRRDQSRHCVLWSRGLGSAKSVHSGSRIVSMTLLIDHSANRLGNTRSRRHCHMPQAHGRAPTPELVISGAVFAAFRVSLRRCAPRSNRPDRQLKRANRATIERREGRRAHLSSSTKSSAETSTASAESRPPKGDASVRSRGTRR